MPESLCDAQQRPEIWNPNQRGLVVYLRNHPGRIGTTTGRTKTSGSHLLVEVNFGPNDISFKRFALLERQSEYPSLDQLLNEQRFGGSDDLRRLLILEKVRGELTNIFYSMDSGLTDYYPHQFKPVLRFLESHSGRLLIADEVGLGKTIEAAYIWKELEARETARRLLVVCPAMLREKWRSDLKRLFGISSQVVNASGLLKELEELQGDMKRESFALIASTESIRPSRGYEKEDDHSPRARLGRFLDENPVADYGALFDLAVIDEAHYMRNQGTAANRLGNLLRDSARHLVLLTATPVQITNENLFRLLELVDPDEFNDKYVFEEMLQANKWIVSAQQALWSRNVDVSMVLDLLDGAVATDYFDRDPVLKRIMDELPSVVSQKENQVRLANMLESRSLLWQYMTRSRKREVLERRVERSPQTLTVELSEEERTVYESLSDSIRAFAAATESKGVLQFALVLRQRQMASSIVAALSSWQNQFDDDTSLEEMHWDDFGPHVSSVDWQDDRKGSGSSWLGTFARQFDLRELEEYDSKYDKLRGFLYDASGKDSGEKIVVFAFFRATLDYLERRLKADGIQAVSIMGGRGEENEAALSKFQERDGPSVLLSSEVGSEGIDLQFCRVLVNYDLPWNPMRVEQRIGRLDRLGQKAERISIINLSIKESIEERVLMRLYDRIQLFKESIGDLEPILGERADDIIGLLLDPNLSREEREQRADEVGLALENRRVRQSELEDNAADLVGLSDIIMQQVDDARRRGHWLSGEDILSLVEDFFAMHYSGTRIQPARGTGAAARILLSLRARADLGNFIREDKPSVHTRLHQSSQPVLCLFGLRRDEAPPSGSEHVEVGHPLVRWIRNRHTTSQERLHPLSAIEIDSAHGVPKGDYAFTVQFWSFEGLRRECQLAYSACEILTSEELESQIAEVLVSSGTRGRMLTNASNVLPDGGAVQSAVKVCIENLKGRFDTKLGDFEAQNELMCLRQLTSARKSAERRMARPKELCDHYLASGNVRMHRVEKGKVDKIATHLHSVVQRIGQKREVDPDFRDVAWGVIRVLG